MAKFAHGMTDAAHDQFRITAIMFNDVMLFAINIDTNNGSHHATS